MFRDDWKAKLTGKLEGQAGICCCAWGRKVGGPEERVEWEEAKRKGETEGGGDFSVGLNRHC